MEEIEQAIRRAWVKRRGLLSVGEIRRRVARGEKGMLGRPPRAWCLAVRAGDRRMEGVLGVEVGRRPVAHEVVLNVEGLRALCRPVRIEWPGERLEAVARKLGVSKQGLLSARLRGVFGNHYVDGPGGQRVPLLYTKALLDPAAQTFRSSDRLWEWTGTWLAAWGLPEDWPGQTLRRVPYFHSRVSGRDTDALHPEHPLNDVGVKVGGKRSWKLPGRPVDYVAYKWKGGEYVGYDWRRAGAREAYERRERALAKRRASRRSWRKGHPERKGAGESLVFRGYRWACPRCGRAVHVLYLPVGPKRMLNVEEALAGERGRADGGRPVRGSVAAGGFACRRCHGVWDLSRASRDAWNQLIGHLSGGLLYGREVERPAWFKEVERVRVREYHPRPGGRVSERRMEVERRLLAGESLVEIARGMRLTAGQVGRSAWDLYQREGVHSVGEWLVKRGMAGPVCKREMVRRLRAGGMRTGEIAREMGISVGAVYGHDLRLRGRGAGVGRADGAARRLREKGDAVGAGAARSSSRRS